MSKKTITVRELVLKANNYFAAEHGSREGRKMLQSFVESILHETGNYVGFGYLTESGVPKGQLPGVIHSRENGNTFPDDSRVVIYSKQSTAEDFTD